MYEDDEVSVHKQIRDRLMGQGGYRVYGGRKEVKGEMGVQPNNLFWYVFAIYVCVYECVRIQVNCQ